jgi:bis(5'-nucleosyl)-tetraphosphatase (symmetrical)
VTDREQALNTKHVHNRTHTNLSLLRSPPLAFGDVHGCRNAFHRLLAKAAPPPDAPLWFTGDLVNRGPDSLGVLRDVIALGPRAITVLGNHELHLLAIAAGVEPPRSGDTLDKIFNAPDADDLIDWIRHRPLAHYENGLLMVHAGVLPQWDVQKTLAYAHELECALRAPDWKAHIAQLRGSKPAHWDGALRGAERLRAIANALTRIRFCSADGEMELNAKGPPDMAPPGTLPWFDIPGRRTANVTVVFGHWAALGLIMRDNLCALDSGCVWGRQLSAVLLTADPRRRAVIQVDAHSPAHKSNAERALKTLKHNTA